MVPQLCIKCQGRTEDARLVYGPSKELPASA